MAASHWLVRLLRHRLLDEGDARRKLGRDALARIEADVAASERRHSGEIRICIEAGLPLSYLRRGASARERAVALFGKLGVWDTARNNGVLIYLLLAERAIEIVADRGLTAVVDAAAWQRIADAMRIAFQGGDFEAGLGRAIAAVDALLVRHFAAVSGEVDVNELPDAPLIR
ncbi:MAG: TPM domain-containing protein [Caldimonas sp.]